MKLKAMLVALFMTALCSSAFAQFFPAQAYISVNPGVVTAQVYNPYYQPIFCSGRAIGLTFSGHPLFALFNDVVPPGQYRFATVFTNHFVNPFVNGWSEIFCRF